MDSKVMKNIIMSGINIKNEIDKIIISYLKDINITLEYINGYDGYHILGDNFLTKIFILDENTINILQKMYFFIFSSLFFKGKKNGVDYKRINEKDGIDKFISINSDGTNEEVACYQNWNNYYLSSSSMCHITLGKIKNEILSTNEDKKRFLYELILKKQFPPLIDGDKYVLKNNLYNVVNSSSVPKIVLDAIKSASAASRLAPVPSLRPTIRPLPIPSLQPTIYPSLQREGRLVDLDGGNNSNMR